MRFYARKRKQAPAVIIVALIDILIVLLIFLMVTTTFNIELGAGGGAFHICIPYAALEPIRDLLYSTMQGDHTEPDRRWIRMLSKQVQSAEVDLVANLANISLTLNQLLNMKIGDVLAADIPPTVTAQVDGVPIFEARYGALNGQYAILIDRVLSPQDDNAGDAHA